MKPIIPAAIATALLLAATPSVAGLRMQPNVPPEVVGRCAWALFEWISYAEDHNLAVDPLIREAQELFLKEMGAHGGEYGQRAYAANKEAQISYQRTRDEQGISAWGQRAADQTAACAQYNIDG